MSRRSVWLWIGLAIIVLTGMTTAAVRRSDPFASLKQYVVSDEIFYWEHGAGADPAFLATRSRRLEVAGLSIEEVANRLKKSFPESDGWEWAKTPSSRRERRIEELRYMRYADRMPTDQPSADTWDEMYVTPTQVVWKNENLLEPRRFEIMFHHRMGRLETIWLRVTNVGRDPFSRPHADN